MGKNRTVEVGPVHRLPARLSGAIAARVALLSLAAVFLTACHGAGSQEEPTGAAAAEKGMGRYVETIYELPQEINRNGGITRQEDGTLALVSYGSGLWVSADGGQTWKSQETGWFPLLQDVYCLDAKIGPDGSVAATCSGEMSETVRAALGKETDAGWEGNYCVFAEPDGEPRVVDFGFSQEDGSCIVSFCYKDDGRLFASDMEGKVYEVEASSDSGSPRLTELFTADRAVGSMSFCMDTLLAVGYDRLYLYDLEGRSLLGQDRTVDAFIEQALVDGSVSYTGGGYPLTVFGGQEVDTIYLACEDGLYRHALGGRVMEQVIDGALSTFGDSNASIYRVFSLEEGEFLAQFSPSAGLVRYTWDAEIPSMPEKELRIYSLEEDKNIRQAVTAYKKDRTDLYVRYEVGMEGEDGITKEDALKKLNLRILSGEGPDVLVLDGLPMGTYVEKGLLSDMGGLLEGLQKDSEVFPNLLEGFTDSGAVYGMPLCFQVPLLIGDRGLVEGMGDLSSFADGMERLRGQNPSGGLLGIYDEEMMLRLFAAVCSPVWQDEDGMADEEAVADFYRQMGRIWQAEQSGAEAEEAEYMQRIEEELAQYGVDPAKSRMDASQNVLYLPAGRAKLAAGYVDGIQLSLDTVTSVLRTDQSLSYACFCGQAGRTFLPKTVVGVSARTGNPEDAEDFIRRIFSAKIQENLYGGFPVNRAAFEERFGFMEENSPNGSMLLERKDGTEQEFLLYWPDSNERQSFRELVEALKVPAVSGGYMEELVCESGVQVLEGMVSAEDAAADVVKKAVIYLAE